MLKSTLPCPLPDIREARIDPTLPVDDSAPSLQACLSGMCRQLQ